MGEFAFSREELPLLASILMDFAEADDELVVSEVSMITTLLCELSGLDELSEAVTAALLSYDSESFDMAAACRELSLDERRRQRQLLALVGSVIAADGVFHAKEDERLQRLARIMGHDAQELEIFRRELVSAMNEFESPA